MFYVFYPTALATAYGWRAKFVRAEHSATAEGENYAYSPTLLFLLIICQNPGNIIVQLQNVKGDCPKFAPKLLLAKIPS